MQKQNYLRMRRAVNPVVLLYIFASCLDSLCEPTGKAINTNMACHEGWKIVDRYIDTLENFGNRWNEATLFQIASFHSKQS